MTDEDARKFVEKENVLLKRKNEVSLKIHESEMNVVTLKEELAEVIQQKERVLQSIKNNAQNKNVFKLSAGLNQIMTAMIQNKSE